MGERGRTKRGDQEKPGWPPRCDLSIRGQRRLRTVQNRTGQARVGRGAPSWDRSRAPVLTVHRGEGVCFAVHIHGEAEEREQRGRRRRVASQTQLQDLRRKGRDGGEGEWAPDCDPALESGGRCAALPAGTPPGPIGARKQR